MARHRAPGAGLLADDVNRPPIVLVVDDHPDLREVLALILEHHGFQVMVAADGREAVSQAERRRPDVVLMDLMMPRMDGYEATAALNDNGGDAIPVVAVTASRVDRTDLLAHGFSELLRKPVRADDVLSTIRRLTA